MQIEVFPSGPFVTNAYVVTCPNTRETAIIDPAPDSTAEIIPYLEENSLIPTKILLTHSHWDHIADIPKLKEIYPNLKIFIHSLDTPNLEKPGSDRLPLLKLMQTGVKPDVLIKEGDRIKVGDLEFEVIHTPGHTPGGVCFYSSEYNTLFSGDTLFRGTIGNISFPTSQPDLMWPSLAKLAKLPPNTIVHPGHGPGTTIGTEHWLPHAKEMFGD